MPPKQQSKADLAKKQKIVEDKTFGLKNKNKSKNVQKYVQSLQQSVQPKADPSKVAAKKKKEDDKAREKELNDFFKVAISQPKVPLGVDPKSILCEFYKAGQCAKGFKCKFSHDLNVQRKGEKIDIYSDQRDLEKDESMEDWDQETLEKVVESKKSEYQQNKPTEIGNNRLDSLLQCQFTLAMQLYHHPYSMESQQVRLVLEEKGIDYTSYHVNPLTGKNMGVSFFRMNPSAKLPVLQNGSHIIYHSLDIIQYLERVTISLNGGGDTISDEVLLWMQQIEAWNPKLFTLSHIPEKSRLFVSRFVRRVVIARMAEAPDLASVYHVKLRDAYETEEKLKDPDIIKQSEEKLVRLLDEAEKQLEETKYLAGEEFTLADSMFIPVLVRLMLLNLEEYISGRPSLLEYYKLVQQRSSYKVVIGRYFSGWRKYRTLLKTICFLCIRSMFRKY